MQKKLSITLGLLLPVLFINAQFKRGDKMAGASVATLAFNSGSADLTVASIGSNTSKNTNYGININPQLGWFMNDKTAIGLTLNINPNGQKISYAQGGTTYQSDKTNGFNIGIGGFIRNYFAGKNLLPFAQFSLNGGISNLKTEGFFYGGSGASGYKQTYTGNSTGGFFANAAFSGGFTKMVGENAGLDIYAGYNFNYNKNTFKRTTLRDDGNNGSIDSRAENETTTKFTNHGFILGVGFQVFIKGKNR